MRTRRFPIRFTGLNKALYVLGMAPRWSYVDVGRGDRGEITVRMSWAFSARIDRSSIRAAAPHNGRVFGWGVHGWAGRWLVNGSSSGIVAVTIDPPARARVMGWPVRLRELLVAVDEPDELIKALSPE